MAFQYTATDILGLAIGATVTVSALILIGWVFDTGEDQPTASRGQRLGQMSRGGASDEAPVDRRKLMAALQAYQATGRTIPAEFLQNPDFQRKLVAAYEQQLAAEGAPGNSLGASAQPPRRSSGASLAAKAPAALTAAASRTNNGPVEPATDPSKMSMATQAMLGEVQELMRVAEQSQQSADFQTALNCYAILISKIDARSKAEPGQHDQPRSLLSQLRTVAQLSQGKVLKEVGRMDDALKSLDSCRENLTSVTPPAVEFLGECDIVRAQVFHALGKEDEASKALESAEDCFVKSSGADSPKMAVAAMVRAEVAQSKKDFAAAGAHREKATQILEKYKTNPAIFAMYINNTFKHAASEQSAGNFDKSSTLLKALVEEQGQRDGKSVDYMLFLNYFGQRLFHQEDYEEAAEWFEKALEVGRNVKNHPGADPAVLQDIVRSRLLGTYDELAFQNDEDAAEKATTLRQELKDDRKAASKTLSRYLKTAYAMIRYMDPKDVPEEHRVNEAPQSQQQESEQEQKEEQEQEQEQEQQQKEEQEQEQKEEQEQEQQQNEEQKEEQEQEQEQEQKEQEEQQQEAADDKVEQPTNDEEQPNETEDQGEESSLAKAPSMDALDRSSDPGALVESIDAVVEEEKEDEEKKEHVFYGQYEIILELTVHPVTGVKLQPGNHLVATFQNPGDESKILMATHTLTEEDVEKSIQPDKSPGISEKSKSTIIMKADGLITQVKKETYECVVDIFADESCDKQLGSHHQLLYGAIESTDYETFKELSSLKLVSRRAVHPDLGLGDLHHG